MPWDVVQSSIDQYLLDLAADDDLLYFLLLTGLLRPLSRDLAGQDRPDNLRRLTVAPEGSAGWLCQKFAEGSAVYAFAPDARMREDLRHIADWLKAALHNDAVWLQDHDPKGRPKKLLKLGSVAQAVREADKAMLHYGQKAAARPYDEAAGERTVMTLADGFRIVQMLTPAALARESGFLGHCVGNGAYNDTLRRGACAFYSLRDPRGRGHATLEVQTAKNALLQCKGKQNRPPVARYMPHIQAFLRRETLVLREAPRMTGLVQVGDEYHDIHHLPAKGLRVTGDLDLSFTEITKLPANLHVNGSLALVDTKITELPENLYVGGDLYLSGDLCQRDFRAVEQSRPFFVGHLLYLNGNPVMFQPGGVAAALG